MFFFLMLEKAAYALLLPFTLLTYIFWRYFFYSFTIHAHHCCIVAHQLNFTVAVVNTYKNTQCAYSVTHSLSHIRSVYAVPIAVC